MPNLRLVIGAFAFLTFTSAALAITEAQAEAMWTDQDQVRAEQFFEDLTKDTVDVNAALAAVDTFSSDQQMMMIGPFEVGGETTWPMSGMLSYFIEDSKPEKTQRLIEFGEGMAQRPVSDIERGHWLAWVSRIRLRTANNPGLARVAAAQARALGTDLCGGDCGPLVNTWLTGAELDAVAHDGPGKVFDPRPSACAEQPASPELSSDPGAFSDAWLQQMLGRIENVVATDMLQWWKSNASGCEPISSYALSTRIDSEFPALLIQSSYASAIQATSLSQPPTEVSFLGYALPLPQVECDFDQAPDCSSTQPLRSDTARVLVSQLRGLSDSLRPIGMCGRGSQGEEKQRHDALNERYQSRIQALAEGSAGDAIQGLELLMVDEQFQPLGDSRASYEVRNLLAKLAKAGESARALNLWQRVKPSLNQPRSAHEELMAKLLLQRQRADESAQILRSMADSGADADAALAWFQLRAGVEGADLSAPVEAPARPWSAYLGDDTYAGFGADSGITIDDIRIGTMDSAQALDALLQANWVELIDTPWRQSNTLTTAFHTAYPGERRVAVFELAMTTVSDQPERGFVLAGRWLPLPEELCTDEGCKAVDSDGLRTLLVHRGLMPAAK